MAKYPSIWGLGGEDLEDIRNPAWYKRPMQKGSSCGLLGKGVKINRTTSKNIGDVHLKGLVSAKALLCIHIQFIYIYI